MNKEKVLRKVIREEIKRLNEQSQADVRGVIEDFTTDSVPLKADSSNTASPTWAPVTHGPMSNSKAEEINAKIRNYLGATEAIMLNDTGGEITGFIRDLFDGAMGGPRLKSFFTKDTFVSKLGSGELYLGKMAGVNVALVSSNQGVAVYVNPNEADNLIDTLSEMFLSQYED